MIFFDKKRRKNEEMALFKDIRKGREKGYAWAGKIIERKIRNLGCFANGMLPSDLKPLSQSFRLWERLSMQRYRL